MSAEYKDDMYKEILESMEFVRLKTAKLSSLSDDSFSGYEIDYVNDSIAYMESALDELEKAEACNKN
jgi:erythromycin esterase-like protein